MFKALKYILTFPFRLLQISILQKIIILMFHIFKFALKVALTILGITLVAELFHRWIQRDKVPQDMTAE